tara:strand:+ start:1625 stop:2212 length:588 start_codon:yes stop_codon:yes gene_type:complete
MVREKKKIPKKVRRIFKRNAKLKQRGIGIFNKDISLMKPKDFLFAQEMNMEEKENIKDKLIQDLSDDVIDLSKKQEPRAVDYEAIIKIQEKIIMTQEETIKKEKVISNLLYDRYSDVMIDNISWRFAYQKLNTKWAKAGIYARDRATYMREYMKRKRANGSIKHWRKYKEEKIMKGSKKYGEKKNAKNKGGTKSK